MKLRQAFRCVLGLSSLFSGSGASATEHQARDLQATCETQAFTSKADLQTAVYAYIDDPAEAELTYGEIKSWCVARIDNMHNLFGSESEFNADLSNWNVGGVTDMNNMFYLAESFNGNVSGWDVSQVKNFNSMFAGAKSFNGDVSGWNVGKVTDTTAMFEGAESFDQDLTNWNLSKVQYMGYMFRGAVSFNGDVSGWDVSNVEDMGSTFMESSFNNNLSNWNASKVIWTSDMFFNSSFNQDLSKWDVSNVEIMDGMFAHSSFNNDLSNWNVSKANMKHRMFYQAGNFDQNLCSWSGTFTDSCWGSYCYEDTFNGTKCPLKSGPTSDDGPWCHDCATGAPTNSPTTVQPTNGPTESPTTDGPTGSPTTDGPTDGPTGSPTTVGPTGSPATDGPTGAPTTNGPTGGPTGGPTTEGPTGVSTANGGTPWMISFLDLGVNFTATSEEEVQLNYMIGKERDVETLLYQEDCKSIIKDIEIALNSTRLNVNATHDLLTLEYNVSKAEIANSSIWNDVTNQIELCQVVNLIMPPKGNLQKMVIVEDIRQITINFNLSSDFSISNELGAGSTESATGQTNVSSYVEACKCSGVDNFTCDPIALVPNTQLYVCITSKSPDVEIKELVSMVVKQGSEAMDVVADGVVQTPSIADMTYDKAENGVVVSTFVPTNIFNYVAGASINITGGVDMQLANSSRRLLTDNIDGDTLNAKQNGEEFSIKIDLQDEVIVLEGEGGWMDSSGAVINGASAMLGMVLLFAFEGW